jgi:hypothetical protein
MPRLSFARSSSSFTNDIRDKEDEMLDERQRIDFVDDLTLLTRKYKVVVDGLGDNSPYLFALDGEKELGAGPLLWDADQQRYFASWPVRVAGVPAI